MTGSAIRFEGSGHAPLVVSTRGDAIENVFHGSIAVVDDSGTLLASAGDPETLTFTRSALKPFQAVPFVLDGGPQALGLQPRELALIASSHSGESFHVEGVERLLAAAGARVAQLRCGCHVPYFHEALRRPVPPGASFDARHHNCSGKHAGFLAYCRLHSLDAERYVERDHPLQQRIRSVVAALAGLGEDRIAVGIDGCSAPNLALPLRSLARLFARLAAAGQNAERREPFDAALRPIADAMATHPQYVSGTGRSDLAFSDAGGGDWICKAGAAGVQGIGVRSRRWGIAVKIGDGNGSARDVAAIEALRQLGLPGAAAPALAQWARPALHNAAELRVGEYAPVFTLRREPGSTLPEQLSGRDR
ncbi:MAG TPA: asparaginase [Burkholderiaceae bacterium]|nr:asparaginase [Burkholderiaceae bacterium]